MMKRCLDEGLLQAYVDGELSPEQASAAAAHIAACDACADALVAAKNETAFFAASFAPDESVNVPTEILRARLSAAVAQLESSPESNRGVARGWSFGGLMASLSGLFTFTPQNAVAFAGLLAFLAVATVLFMLQKSQQTPNNDQVARVENTNPTPATPSGVNLNPNDNVPPPAATPEIQKQETIFMQARHVKRPANRKNASGSVTPPRVKEQSLPGEKDYQTAIASLEKTIKMGGDAVLRPAVRVEYERNLAILDSAIGETRRVASENPKDKDAVGFLLSAYQSKVELLTKVAEQAQVSALGR